jgi:K+-sensing histidine kinase KdpD
VRVAADSKSEPGQDTSEADPRSHAEPSAATLVERDEDALLKDGATSAAQSARPAVGVLSYLLASARHELRSPLQSIQGFAELLGAEAYGALSPQQHQFVEHILQGSSELSAILDACLDLTELELLRRPLEPALIDVSSTLFDALSRASAARGMPLALALFRAPAQQLAWLDVDAIERALSVLLTGLGANANRPFRVEVEFASEQALVRLSTDARSPAPTLTFGEFAERRRSPRALVWLRLASVLLERQSGLLLISEPLDYAEVRLRLSRTH